jgi:hypothetical protein
MELNVVNKSEFSSGGVFGRLDAEYVSKSIWEMEKHLRRQTGYLLAKEIVGYDGPALNDSFRPAESILDYIAIDSIDTSDGLTHADELRYEDRPSRAKYLTQQGDVLVSNVRPNRGAVALIGELRSGCAASSGFSLLRTKAGADLSQAFIFAFLKSRYGRSQLERRARGSMYPAIVYSDLTDVWIPKPPKAVSVVVEENVILGVALQEEFFRLVKKQGEMMAAFLEPVGAPPSPLSGDTSKVNYTEVLRSASLRAGSAERIDAEFFRSEYAEFDEKLKREKPTFLLGAHFALTPGRGLGSGEAIVPFIKQGVLTNAGVNWSAISYEEGSGAPKGGRVSAGDILLACTAHEIYYVGRKVDFVRDVPAQLKDNEAVPDLMILRPRPEKPPTPHGSYVAAFLRCPSGLHQVQRCIRGLRGGHVYKHDLAAYVRVPVPPDEWLLEFEKRAEEYEGVRDRAKLTMNRAFKVVEDWVGSI